MDKISIPEDINIAKLALFTSLKYDREFDLNPFINENGEVDLRKVCDDPEIGEYFRSSLQD